TQDLPKPQKGLGFPQVSVTSLSPTLKEIRVITHRQIIYSVNKVLRVAVLSGSSLQQCFLLLGLAILRRLQSLIKLLHLLAGESILKERNLNLGAGGGFESKLFNRHVGSPKIKLVNKNGWSRKNKAFRAAADPTEYCGPSLSPYSVGVKPSPGRESSPGRAFRGFPDRFPHRRLPQHGDPAMCAGRCRSRHSSRQ